MSVSPEPPVPAAVAVPAARRQLDGGQLAAIANALVIVELRDAYLTVERTLIERGQVNTVRQTRLTFQQAMFTEFLDAIERLTGRKVSSYVSESITAPEVILEIFYLEPLDDRADRLFREAREDAGDLERPTGGIPEKISSRQVGEHGAPDGSSGKGFTCRCWR